MRAEPTGDPSLSIISRDEYLSSYFLLLRRGWCDVWFGTLIHTQDCVVVVFSVIAGEKALGSSTTVQTVIQLFNQ